MSNSVPALNPEYIWNLWDIIVLTDRYYYGDRDYTLRLLSEYYPEYVESIDRVWYLMNSPRIEDVDKKIGQLAYVLNKAGIHVLGRDPTGIVVALPINSNEYDTPASILNRFSNTLGATTPRAPEPASRATTPRTTAPRTIAPRTTAPRTIAPRTTAPRTTGPKTTAPRTSAPEPAPKTTAPEPAPKTTAPRTIAPKTTAPRTTAPKTTAPRTTAPEPAPKTTAPKTTAPKTTAPKTTAPKTTAPKTTASRTTASRTTASRTTAPSNVTYKPPYTHHKIFTRSQVNDSAAIMGMNHDNYSSPQTLKRDIRMEILKNVPDVENVDECPIRKFNNQITSRCDSGRCRSYQFICKDDNIWDKECSYDNDYIDNFILHQRIDNCRAARETFKNCMSNRRRPIDWGHEGAIIRMTNKKQRCESIIANQKSDVMYDTLDDFYDQALSRME